jgi:hypothetical protein
LIIDLSSLALVIGIITMIKGRRKLRGAQAAAADARRKLEDCEEACRELQEFVVLFNYGATQEAYEHLRACGFATTLKSQRPQSSR